MKKLKQIVGEKLTREVSQLIGSPIGRKPESESEFSMEELVSEAADATFHACFRNIREYLRQNGNSEN